MSMMPASTRPRPVPAAETPLERLARLYGLRQRIDLEIAAAEALVAGQEAAVIQLQNRYSTTIAKDRDRAGRRKVAICGTDSGYYKHRRKQEDACEPCRIAHAAAERDRAARARNVD